MAAVLEEVWYRGRPHKFVVQLIQEDTEAVVSALLSTFSHRLIFKLRHSDADGSAVFNQTTGFAVYDEVTKKVEVTIPASATDVAAIPEGRTTRGYLQWQTTDGSGNVWVVADGSGIVKSVLDRTT